MRTLRKPSGPNRELKKERMVLLGLDREAFLAAVTDLPEPTEKLVAVLKRHHKSAR